MSSYDLATHCRFALHDRPGRFKMFYRWGLLYPLYAMAEAGIIMTDLAELLGSAIAINLLIPAIPLWACVLLTSLDVFLILLLFNQCEQSHVLYHLDLMTHHCAAVLADPSRTMTTSMRMFELLIGLLVACVLACFVAMLVKVGPDWGDVFLGYVPSSGIFANGGIYIAVGIVGATVMPHAFYIGSKMACMQRLRPEEYGEEPDSEEYDSDDYYSDKESDDEDEDDLKKGVDAGPAAAVASVRSGRRRRRSGNAGRRDAAPPGARPYIPFLHLPHPVRMPNVGFDLGALSRARTEESPERTAGTAAGRTSRTSRASGWNWRGHFGQGKARASAEARTPELGHELAGVSPRQGSELRSAPMDDIVDISAPAAEPAAVVVEKKPARRGRRPAPSLACVRAHLTHACLDVAGSLLGFALVVNSSILILGAAVFYYGDGQSTSEVGVRCVSCCLPSVPLRPFSLLGLSFRFVCVPAQTTATCSMRTT